MKPKKHFVDLWCEEQFNKFPFAPKEAKNIMAKKEIYGDVWPDWCGFPMAATSDIITRYANVSTAKQILAQLGVAVLSDLTAALLWSQTKSVYRFDPDFYVELTKKTKIEKIPINILHQLPFHCVFIEAPATYVETTSKGFFAWLEFDTNRKVSELRLLFLFNGGYTIPFPLILTGGDINDAIEILLKTEIIQTKAYKTLLDNLNTLNIDYDNEESDNFIRDITSALNAVLYLCSINSTKEYESFSHTTSISTSKDKYGNPKKHRYWDVGVRFGKAFRAQHSKQNNVAKINDDNKQVKHSIRPHVRRAHWHHFWTGKRESNERKLVLRWVHPVFVGEDEDLPTVIHRIEN